MCLLDNRGLVNEDEDAGDGRHDQDPGQRHDCNDQRGDEPDVPFHRKRETGEKIAKNVDDAEEAAEEHQGGYVIFSNLGIGCVKSRDMCRIGGDGSCIYDIPEQERDDID